MFSQSGAKFSQSGAKFSQSGAMFSRSGASEVLVGFHEEEGFQLQLFLLKALVAVDGALAAVDKVLAAVYMALVAVEALEVAEVPMLALMLGRQNNQK